MTDAAFLAAIIADPDADAPRLVYPDWLDEHGHTDRAEFIRVQCELARTSDEDGRYSELQAREYRLLGRHFPEWAGPFGRVRFRRGFVEAVRGSARTFLECADELFAKNPVRDVGFDGEDEPGYGDEIAARTWRICGTSGNPRSPRTDCGPWPRLGDSRTSGG